jgi:hypothetical protein
MISSTTSLELLSSFVLWAGFSFVNVKVPPATEVVGGFLLKEKQMEQKPQMIEIKQGNKTTYCFKKSDNELEQKD